MTRLRHRFDLSPAEAVRLQRRLRGRLLLRGGPREARRVAAADAAFDERFVYGAVVVWDSRTGTILERSAARRRLAFPYVPGLLSFREAPVLLDAFRALRARPDLLLVDGQGIAHPRGFGIACHLGLLLDLPTVGVAKSRLVGAFEEPGPAAGAVVPLRDRGRTIGWVLRSRRGGKPIFVSPGHRVGLRPALRLVRETLRGFRLPEPLRAADRSSREAKRFSPGRKNTDREARASRSFERPPPSHSTGPGGESS